jgi:hypothetical protein
MLLSLAFNYNFMLKQKNLDNLNLAWETICTKLNEEGKDFHTVSNRPIGKERWFHASVYHNRIFIERAKDTSKNSKITMRYPIRQQEFNLLANYYNNYAENNSNEIRKTDSHMSSYIITLISELL